MSNSPRSGGGLSDLANFAGNCAVQSAYKRIKGETPEFEYTTTSTNLLEKLNYQILILQIVTN